MKKFLSTILAVVMVLGSMAMVVSANDADYAEGYYYVNGEQYTDFMAAVSAANGGTVIVSGECAFGSRLAVNSSVTLQGVNNATIVPSASYGSTDSTTNWKGLLNIAGENVIVNDITFDGSAYGDTITSSTDFVPVRCTSGNITLNNVTITGSPRSLMIVGSSSSEANVTANGLYCDAPLKTIDGANTYADINVVDGTFTLQSGLVNGFIAEDYGSGYAGTFINEDTDVHFTLDYIWTDYILGFIPYTVEQTLTSTYKHYVECYNYAVENGYSDVSAYVDSINNNMLVVADMMEEAKKAEYAEYATSFGNLLLAASEEAEGDNVQTLINYASELGVTQEG